MPKKECRSCSPWYYSVLVYAVAAWAVSTVVAFIVARKHPGNALVLFLTWFVVSVGLYRSIFPVKYSSRLTWHADNAANAAVTVRCIAFLAELAMAGSVAITYTMGGQGGWLVATFFSLIAAAQVPATIGTATSLKWLFALEETLWAVAAALLVPGAVALLATKRTFAIVMLVALSIYLLFQVIAVPIQWAGRLGVASKLPWDTSSNASQDCHRYGALFFVWSTGYFVLLSALMIYLQTLPTL